jgi:predicted ABC-type sugar transport system permease subunit
MGDRDNPALQFLRDNRSIVFGITLLILLILAGGALGPGFLWAQNARSILLLASFPGLASLGQTLCALLGGIDLAVPYVIGAAIILLPAPIKAGATFGAAIVLVFAAGLTVGCVTGVLSFRLHGQALIMSPWRGIRGGRRDADLHHDRIGGRWHRFRPGPVLAHQYCGVQWPLFRPAFSCR